MKTIAIEFLSHNRKIKGRLHLPTGAPAPVVVGSHGLEGSMASAKQEVLSRILPEMGVAFLRFDHRGCGCSGGDFITDTSLDNRVDDLINAVEHLWTLGKTRKSLMLFGSSMGGATCIAAWSVLAERGIRPKGAVLCASPVDSATIKNIPTAATNNRPALPLTFFTDNLLFNLKDQLPELHHVLIFHGDSDSVVPVDNGHILYRTVGDPKKLILHKNGDHQMSEPDHQIEFEQEVKIWVRHTFHL